MRDDDLETARAALAQQISVGAWDDAADGAAITQATRRWIAAIARTWPLAAPHPPVSLVDEALLLHDQIQRAGEPARTSA